jgi:serine/threonine protein phosphatase 1
MAGRLLAVGDIHGCARELETLVGALRLERDDTLAFVGDYVDRGPDSRAVVDLLLGLRDRADAKTVFLKGNHEDMCLGYLGRDGHWGEAWQANGGAATLRSYGIDPGVAGAEAAARMPPAHLAFLEGLKTALVGDRYLVVHAGIRPSRPWAEQDLEDLLWIREEFTAVAHPLPQTIVFGHTPHRHVLVDLPYKIGIDTGCVYGGALTCVDLPAGRLYQVRAGERRVRQGTLAAPPPRRFW